MLAIQYVTSTTQARVAPAISRSRTYNTLHRPPPPAQARGQTRLEKARVWYDAILAHQGRSSHAPGLIHSSVVAQSPTLQLARTSLQQPSGMQIALTAAWLLSRLPRHCRSDNLTAASTQSLLHSNNLSSASLFCFSTLVSIRPHTIQPSNRSAHLHDMLSPLAHP